jgi:hypothetical protein
LARVALAAALACDALITKAAPAVRFSSIGARAYGCEWQLAWCGFKSRSHAPRVCPQDDGEQAEESNSASEFDWTDSGDSDIELSVAEYETPADVRVPCAPRAPPAPPRTRPLPSR